MKLPRCLERFLRRFGGRRSKPQADDDVVVLGVEFARAAEADQAWRRDLGNDAVSPIGAAYDFWRGETDLLRFVASDLDDRITGLVGHYSDSSPSAAPGMRDRLGLDDCYTLLTFAKRAAVRALRAGDPGPAVAGLAAIAMVEPGRVDRRDFLQPIGLLSSVLTHLEADTHGALGRVAALAEPELGEYLRSFRSRTEDLSEWGYELAHTPAGIGLAENSHDTGDASVDLLDVGLSLAEVIDADSYRTSSVTLGSRMPGVWVWADEAHQERVSALDRVRAGLTIDARLRPDASPDAERQQFAVFVSEAADPSDAKHLSDWADESRGRVNHVGFGVHSGPLVCVLVARSTLQGTPAFETAASIERFAEPFATALERVL